MHHLNATLALLLCLCLSLSANAQDKLPDAPIEIPEEAKGKICDLVLKKAEQESTATDISEYVGTVVRFDDKVVVLKNASRQVRIHRGLPSS